MEALSKNPDLAQTHVESHITINNGRFMNEWINVFVDINPLKDEIDAKFAKRNSGEDSVVTLYNKEATLTEGSMFTTLRTVQCHYNITMSLGTGQVSDEYASMLMHRSGVAGNSAELKFFKE